MAVQNLDCRGLHCPQPVLKVKELIDKGGVDRLTIVVDNLAARENVGRFLERSGYGVSASQQGDAFMVMGIREGATAARDRSAVPSEAKSERKIAVLVGTDRMGTGDDSLGSRLLVNFLGTLKEMGSELWRLIFLNAGVKLTIEGAESLSTVRELEAEGVSILVCGTCLSHFGLLEKERVGETTNMLDIVTALQVADKVISLT
jgi:selenium metabolism protein YedF